jgi:hypothetical protein
MVTHRSVGGCSPDRAVAPGRGRRLGLLERPAREDGSFPYHGDGVILVGRYRGELRHAELNTKRDLAVRMPKIDGDCRDPVGPESLAQCLLQDSIDDCLQIRRKLLLAELQVDRDLRTGVDLLGLPAQPADGGQ